MLAGVKFIPRDQVEKVKFITVQFALVFQCSPNLRNSLLLIFIIFLLIPVLVVRQRMKARMQREGNPIVGRKSIGERRRVQVTVVRMMILRE